jgi:hypothetical protein
MSRTGSCLRPRRDGLLLLLLRSEVALAQDQRAQAAGITASIAGNRARRRGNRRRADEGMARSPYRIPNGASQTGAGTGPHSALAVEAKGMGSGRSGRRLQQNRRAGSVGKLLEGL